MATARCDGLGMCPVEAALERIGGKWKGVALYHLLEGPLRYNELSTMSLRDRWETSLRECSPNSFGSWKAMA